MIYYTETILNTVYIMPVKDIYIFEFDNLVLVFARGIRKSYSPLRRGI